MKQKKGCGGLTEEDCVPRALCQRSGRRETKGGNNDGGEKKRRSRGAVRMLNGG